MIEDLAALVVRVPTYRPAGMITWQPDRLPLPGTSVTTADGSAAPPAVARLVRLLEMVGCDEIEYLGV